MVIERVIFILNYHDGPKSGLSVNHSTGNYFFTSFRDDLDDYDPIYSLLRLEEQELSAVKKLFDRPRDFDSQLEVPERRALFDSIERRFCQVSKVNPQDLVRAEAKFHRTGSAGRFGAYNVEWLPL